MRYIWQHINNIVADYDGSLPLAHYLKHYYKQNQKLGSRDRRMLSTIIYSWYRCAKGLGTDGKLPTEAAVASCLATCGTDMAAYERIFSHPAPPITPVDTELLFPNDTKFSEGMTRSNWLTSMLLQPALFIRVRKNKEQVCRILDDNNITYSFLSATCLQLPNGTSIDKLLPADCYVVQDASSQQTAAFMRPANGEQWYDCCSGAGGKSLLLMDAGVKVALTVSDKRASILHNLGERFRLYGHKQPTTIVADAADSAQLATRLGDRKFDHIICDVPCTGSGTWARTPEQLHFFQTDAIAEFSALQQQIATNVCRFLKPGGTLIYITCSVFRQENEDVVTAVAGATGMAVKEQELINGISRQSDSMFAAVLG